MASSAVWTAVQTTALQVVWALCVRWPPCSAVLVAILKLLSWRTARRCAKQRFRCAALCIRTCPVFLEVGRTTGSFMKIAGHNFGDRFAISEDLGLGNDGGDWGCTGIQSSNN